MVRTKKQQTAEPESWVDPLWTHVLGEGEETKKKRSWGIRRRSKEKPTTTEPSSLFDYLGDDRNANSSSRQASVTHRTETHQSKGLFNRKVEEGRGLSFFEAESLTNEQSAWSFLDQPYEIPEKEWKKQQKKELSEGVKQKRAEEKARRAAEKETKIKLKPPRKGKNNTADDAESWLDIFTSADAVGSKPSRFRIRNAQSGDSRSIVSTGSFYDQPYEMSEREWKWQRKRETKQEKRNQRQEKKAQKAAARETKIKLKRGRLKKGNDDDSWLAMFSSGEDGKSPRRRPPIRIKSKQSTGSETCSIISAGSWFQTDDKAVRKKTVKSKDRAASGDLSVKVWNGLTATFEPWIDDETDDNYSSSTSFSGASSETGDSTSADEESQAASRNSATDEEEDDDGTDGTSTLTRNISEYPDHSLERRISSAELRPILKSKRQNGRLRQPYIPVPANTLLWQHRRQGAAVDGDSYASDTYDDAQQMRSRSCDYLPTAAHVNSEEDIIPDHLRTTVTPVGEAYIGPAQWQPVEYHNDRSLEPFSLALNPAPRVACCSIKNLSPEQLKLARESGFAIHELSQDELATIFPKVRSVANDIKYSRPQSLVIGNSLSFEKNVPAHVQAVLKQEGPQSLYEYEYELAVQKLIMYETFGNRPRDLLKIHIADGPPEVLDESMTDQRRVTIQVEASTVSPTDCAIRRGDFLGKRHVPLPNSPGVDAVGVIYRVDGFTEKKHDLRKGERVISLTKWGGNSRYLAVKPEELVKVPDCVDPAEAACLPETYLSVFQVLHHGQSTNLRYRSNALKGKSFLVIGNIQSNFGRAIGQLATIGGAENVYATATRSKHVQKLVSYGILPLLSNTKDPLDWCARLENRIDFIISLDEPLTPLHHKVLKASGEVIVMAQAKEQVPAESDEVESRAAILNCSRNKQRPQYLYDAFMEWDRNLKRCKGDLQYLVDLLRERKIQPYILDRIPLSKVPKAQEMIELKRLPGFIVCEPWLVSKSRAVVL